jgi:hypothetical protein
MQTSTAIYNVAAGQCLGFSEKMKKPSIGARVSIEICSEDSPLMKWDLISYVDL